MSGRALTIGLVVGLVACGAPPAPSVPAADALTDAHADAGPSAPEDAQAEAPADAQGGPTRTTPVTFDFGTWGLLPFEEVPSICAAWTLHNEAPLYVETLRMLNGGAFHHANWFVVPEENFEGPDGWFACRQRDFREAAAVLLGTPLFAQSTQTRFETQTLGTGVAIKIPPRHRIIASVHMLNLGARSVRTSLQVTLDLLHPRDVARVAAPFRLFYDDLHIRPGGRSDFTTTCDLATPFAQARGRPLELSLYYILPHYHGLGRRFEIELAGGPREGESVYRLDGFDGLAHGRAFDPPLDLAAAGATGFRLRCTFDNASPTEVGYGLADGEMCMALGFADVDALFDAGATRGDSVVGVSPEGVERHEAPCEVLTLPRKASQGDPSEAERAGPLTLPPVDAQNGAPVEPVEPPVCVESDPAAAPAQPITLAAIRDEVFKPGCTFSACHGGPAPAAGLALDATDLDALRAALVRHDVQAETVLKLVDPGDAVASWLYQRVSQCAARDDRGRALAPMPLGAPERLADDQVARIKAWIDEGAEAR